MSRLNRKRVFACDRNVFAFRDGDHWDVYVESESILGPRNLQLTKREAIHLAYQIAISKKQKLTVTYS